MTALVPSPYWSFRCRLLLLAFSATSAQSYINPTLPNVDAPDPGVLRWNQTTFLVASTGGDAHGVFPIRQSTDLTHWSHKPINYIFRDSTGPAWSIPGSPWAPELHTNGFDNGNVLAYYVSRHKNSKLLSIGAAVVENATTTDPSDWIFQSVGKPLVHNVTGNMGSIDPSHFFDGATSKHWLLYKSDGNAKKVPTVLFAQELTRDGTRSVGEAFALLENNPTLWNEGNCIEAPWMIRHPHTKALIMFYSGPGYCPQCGYSVSVARSDSGHILGPWKKYNQNPIMTQNTSNFESPGHCSVVNGVNGGLAMVYHAYVKGREEDGRHLMLDELEWNDEGWVNTKHTCGQPSETAQPIP